MLQIIVIVIAVLILVDIYTRFRYHKRNILVFFDDLEKRMGDRISALERRVNELEKHDEEKLVESMEQVADD